MKIPKIILLLLLFPILNVFAFEDYQSCRRNLKQEEALILAQPGITPVGVKFKIRIFARNTFGCLTMERVQIKASGFDDVGTSDFGVKDDHDIFLMSSCENAKTFYWQSTGQSLSLFVSNLAGGDRFVAFDFFNPTLPQGPANHPSDLNLAPKPGVPWVFRSYKGFFDSPEPIPNVLFPDPNSPTSDVVFLNGCGCDSDFKTATKKCEDIDECLNPSSNTCGQLSTCINRSFQTSQTGYDCQCVSGTFYDATGRTIRNAADVTNGNRCKPGVFIESSQTSLFFKHTNPQSQEIRVSIEQKSVDGLTYFPVSGSNVVLNGTKPEASINALISGAVYKVNVRDRNNVLISSSDERTSCSCTKKNCVSFDSCRSIKDASDEPFGFSAIQQFGQIIFRWQDMSTCDDSFQITRTEMSGLNEISTANTFSSLYSISSECFSLHNPESIQDSIARSNLVLGSSYKYCIQALSTKPFLPEYKSKSVCVLTPVIIQWESTLRVRVINQGGQRVKNVLISCFNIANRTAISCSPTSFSLSTAADGIALVHLKQSNVVSDVQNIIVTFSKTTGNVSHKFTLSNNPASEVTMSLRHLNFDESLDVVDITSVPISGRVLVANTENCPYPSKTSSPVKICVIDTTNNVEVECTNPDPFTGEYRLSATIGMFVNLTITEGEHVFIRSNESLVSFPRVASQNEDYARINFYDISTRAATITFVGGECNIDLGLAKFEILLADNNCMVTSKPIRETDLISYLALLPVHLVRIRPIEVKNNDFVISESADIVDFFARGELLPIDIEQLRFEYHPKPEKIDVFLSFLENVVGSNCNNQEVALDSDVNRTVLVSVKENYPKLRTCSKVSGTVHWENKVGETPELVKLRKSLSSDPSTYKNRDRCYDGLPLDECTFLFRNLGENSVSAFELIPGFPSLIARQIKATVSIKPFGNQNIRNVTKTQDVFVLGMIKTDDLYAVQLPTHDPLLVLRDPPGSRSFASYKNVRTTVSIESSTHKVLKSDYVNLRMGGGLRSKIGDCKGFGYEFCNGIFEAEVGVSGVFRPICDSEIAKKYNLKFPDCDLSSIPIAILGGVGAATVALSNPLVGIGVGIALGVSTLNKDSATVTTLANTVKSNSVSIDMTWTATTAGSSPGSAALPGKESDLFMIPTASIKFAKADVFSWDKPNCKVKVENEIVWDLDTQVPAIGFVSYAHIKNHEIPELIQIRNFQMSKGENVTELNKSIANWNKLISEHDAWHNEAREKKNLTGFAQVTSLVSPQLQKNVNSLNPSSSTLAPTNRNNDFYHDASVFDKDTLEEIVNNQQLPTTSRIVFSGGGSSYTFTENNKVSLAQTKIDPKQLSNTTTDTVTAFEVDGKIHAGYMIMPGLQVKFSMKQDMSQEKTFSSGQGREASTEISFTLSDPDASDYFVVDVYRDPKFGTFAFHTIAGESKCPHEANTIAIEEPEFRISKKPLHPILPGEEGEIEVEFRNKGSGNSSFELFMSNLENSGGLDIPQLRSPMALSSLDGKIVRKHVFKVSRGPELYDYPPFNIGLRSVCESGIASQEAVSLSFLEACPAVNLEVSSEYSFISKSSSTVQGMQVFFSNPSQPFKEFSQVQRLQSISLEYRLISELFVARTESLGWIPALGMNGQVLNLKTQENEGFVIWNTLVLPDGVYEYRLRSKCVPWTGIGKVSNGVNEFVSGSARLLIDKQTPKVSGSYEPADLVYFPGDELSVTFSENLDCAKPYPFIVKLNVNGMPLDTFEVNKNLAIFCEGNKISMDLDFDADGSTKFKDLMQKEASFYIEGVRDIAGNLCEKRIVHDFKFANIDQSKATIVVKNIQITGIADFANGLYVPGSPDWNTAAQQILEKFSQDKLIPLSRLKIESFTYDNVFIATILVLPETEESLNGRRLQQKQSQEDLATQLTLAGLSIDLIPGTQDLEEQAPAKSTLVFQSGSSQRELAELKSSFETSLAKLEASMQELKENSSLSNSNNSNALFMGLGVGLGSFFVFGGLFLHSRRRMQQQIDEHRKSLPVVTLQHSTSALGAHVNV